ncbi:MAG: nucleotidyltransferase domain-containing protein [Candidatus Kapabacteria bacterium]|nr:nucleotidyltransferase domain-containing protein [Candidatus Kapabacteria bacterium]
MIFKKDYIRNIREKAKEFDVKKIILFGSALDNPENCNDIDLACDIPGLNLFLFGSKLEEMLKIPVDITPLDYNDPFMRIITKYGKVIYES